MRLRAYPFVPLLATVLLSSMTYAAETAPPSTNPSTPANEEPLPPPPIPENYTPPETDLTTEELQPEVRITTKGEEIHHEYRINGKLYMVKVMPAAGPPYYLIDQEGDGNFTRTNLGPDVTPPMWVIKEF